MASNIDPLENIGSKSKAALSNVGQLLYTMFLITSNNITSNFIRKCFEARKLKMKETYFQNCDFFHLKTQIITGKKRYKLISLKWQAHFVQFEGRVCHTRSTTHSLKQNGKQKGSVKPAAQSHGSVSLCRGALCRLFPSCHTVYTVKRSQGLRFSNRLLYLTKVQSKEDVYKQLGRQLCSPLYLQVVWYDYPGYCSLPTVFPPVFWHHWYKYQHSN